MKRAIVGYHRDDVGDWVAELECGHAQHVRHDPPWQLRMLLGGAITLAVGAAVHEWVEKPALRLKARRTSHDLASAGA